MYRARRTFIATSLVALLAIAGVTAAVAANPAPAPPPKIAFLANGIVPADALAAGPIAGQLGAPVYTTQQDALPTGTADALAAYSPELIIVMGGPVAISEAVVTQVSAATGLPVVDPTPAPASGVVRAAGGDRFETATIVADLLAAYAPAYLPVDLQAVDADLLDGMDSTEFLKSADPIDADTLDGNTSAEIIAAATPTVRWVAVDADSMGASILRQSGGVSNPVRQNQGDFSVDFDIDIHECNWQATYTDNGGGAASGNYVTVERLLGADVDTLLVRVKNSAGADVDPSADDGFNLLVTC